MTETLERQRATDWRSLPELDSGGDEPDGATWHGLPIPFLKKLGGIATLAAVVRVVFILGWHQEFPLWGDAWVYHHQARFIANGHWFIQPVDVLFNNEASAAADHPPLFTLILAVGYVLGVRAPYGQMLINAGLGVATVMLIGLVARRIGGNRLGLIAAVIAAVYPNMWGWNGQVLSETLSVLMVTLTLFFAYRFIDGRQPRDLVLTAAMAALGALSRSEVLLLIPFLVFPMLISEYRRTHEPVRVAKLTALAGVAAVLILLPWSAFNLSRFEEPALMGNGLGRALDSGACPDAFTGYARGFWKIDCLGEPMGVTKAQQQLLDESQLDKLYREDAIRIYKANLGELPLTLGARVGRMFHFYAPLQQLDFDQLTEGREWWLSSSGWSTYYLVAGFAIAGGIALRRRMRIMYPLVMPIVIAVIGAMVAFGTTRYRAPAEPALVLLAAVGAEWVVQALEARARRKAEERSVAAALAVEGADAEGTTAAWVPLPARPFALNSVLIGVVAVIIVAGALGAWAAAATDHTKGGIPAQVQAPPIPDSN